MREYSSDQFHYHRDTDTLTADASDIGGTAIAMSQGWQIDGQIYDDAADVGIAIRSRRSGKLAIYVRKAVDEKHGEIRAWEYVPARRRESMMCPKGDIAPWDSYKHTKVTIFND